MNTEQEWSTVRQKQIDFSKYLQDQIRTRYAMYSRPEKGKLNQVIDSFVPNLLVSSGMYVEADKYPERLPKTACAISPWFASLYNVRQIPAEQLCLILGYTKKDLTKLMRKVKQANYAVSFIGYGGTNVNTLHWLNEISKFTNVINIFKNINIFEEEDIDISNLLRFPKSPTKSIQSVSKLSLLEGEPYRLAAKTNLFYRYWLSYNTYYKKYSKHVFYGAPNIRTRVALSDIGWFISATHSNASCSLHLNPTQDTTLQVESYGVIQLSNFFMNQLRMAIGFLEILADPQFNGLEKNKELLDFSFDGTSVLKADRNYSFQLEHSGLVATEEGVNL